MLIGLDTARCAVFFDDAIGWDCTDTSVIPDDYSVVLDPYDDSITATYRLPEPVIIDGLDTLEIVYTLASDATSPDIGLGALNSYYGDPIYVESGRTVDGGIISGAFIPDGHVHTLFIDLAQL